MPEAEFWLEDEEELDEVELEWKEKPGAGCGSFSLCGKVGQAEHAATNARVRVPTRTAEHTGHDACTILLNERTRFGVNVTGVINTSYFLNALGYLVNKNLIRRQ